MANAEHQQLSFDALASLNGDGFRTPVTSSWRSVPPMAASASISRSAGHPVKLQSMFIPAAQATAGVNDPGLPVLHFTHSPNRFVI